VRLGAIAQIDICRTNVRPDNNQRTSVTAQKTLTLGLFESEATADAAAASVADSGLALEGGHAAVGVLTEADEAAAVSNYLAKLGGASETYEAPDEALEHAAAQPTS
jgi:ethanolamine ammonia-lyase large subunit